MNSIKSYILAVIVLFFFSCMNLPVKQIPLDSSGVQNYTRLKYYGVDNVSLSSIDDVQHALGKQINIIVEGVDCNDFATLDAMIKKAEEKNMQLIIWPHGYGHQWTPWKWTGTEWDISEGYDFLDYLKEYAANGGTAIHSYLMSHEPFWNHGDPFSSDQMKALYAKLETYAPGIKKFVYIGNLSYNENYYSQGWEGIDVIIEDGLADVACIWWHGFGGQEGAPSYEQVTDLIQKDAELIKSRGLQMELFFALQCFGWTPQGYEMPNAQEIIDLGNLVLQTNVLDGLLWYCWEPYTYTESLQKNDVDQAGRSRHQAIRILNGAGE